MKVISEAYCFEENFPNLEKFKQKEKLMKKMADSFTSDVSLFIFLKSLIRYTLHVKLKKTIFSKTKLLSPLIGT